MALNSLNSLRTLRLYVTGLRRWWLVRAKGIDLAEGVSVSLAARFVSAERGSVAVGSQSLIAFKALLISVDADGATRPVRIGANCFIGGGATILPGVTIGQNSIVGAGAVVFTDVPPYSIVVGNPARVVASDPTIGPYGRLAVAAQNTSRYWSAASG